MICLNCFKNKVIVANSRQLKKSPEVWRRRKCLDCEMVFTTRETADFSDLIRIESQGRTSKFDKARMVVSLVRVLDSTGMNASDAYWLAETVTEKIFAGHKTPGKFPIPIADSELTYVIYETLAGYHPVAGLAYGSAHGLVRATSKRGRGRPRLTTP